MLPSVFQKVNSPRKAQRQDEDHRRYHDRELPRHEPFVAEVLAPERIENYERNNRKLLIISISQKERKFFRETHSCHFGPQ